LEAQSADASLEAPMSDAEHELFTDVLSLRQQLRELATLAARALEAARDAQDARGGHDSWLDEALTDVEARLRAGRRGRAD
jgi:hypothetical protein